MKCICWCFFFFSSRRRHTRYWRDWSSDVCSSDLRQIAYRAGVPETVPASTINQACGSGLKAIILAAEQIMLGRARAVLAGGVESMSRVPYFAEGVRWGVRMGNAELVDGMRSEEHTSELQ